MNPYQNLVAEYARLARESKTYPKGGFPSVGRPDKSPDSPKALFFAPHPDDECVVGGLALRVMRETEMNVINVAVTQGSKKERQAERLVELRKACSYIGFGLITTGPNGLQNINLMARERDPSYWSACVKVIAEILKTNQPRVIFFPHEHDWNSTHIGTHFLVMDALAGMPAEFGCFLVETEYWGQMTQPNLMIEFSQADLADLMTAATFHVGEMNRIPFHLLMPAWMMDNVRRGSELVGGQGEGAPDFTFAALYRLRRWHQGQVREVLDRGTNLAATTNAGSLFHEHK